MKKFLVLISLSAILAAFTPIRSTAQTSGEAQLFALRAGDTIITSGSVDTMFKILPITAGYSSLAIQIEGTKVSGTVGGKAYLWRSLTTTSSRYVLVDSSAAFTNGDNTVQFQVINPAFTRYKIEVRSSNTGANTTQSNIIRIYFAAKEFDDLTSRINRQREPSTVSWSTSSTPGPITTPAPGIIQTIQRE